MKNTLRKDIFAVEIPDNLSAKIMLQIGREQLRQARRKAILYVSTMLISLGFFALALQYALEQFAESEFPRLVSLLYSDMSLITVFWKDLSYAFVESVPLVSVALLLITLLALLWTGQKSVQNVSIIRKPLAV